MEVRGNKDSLVEAAQTVLRVVAQRAPLPVLGGIRLTAAKEVEFAGSDLEVFGRIVGDFEVVAEGSVVAPGRLFVEVLRSLPPGEVRITGTDGEVRVEGGTSEFELSSFPVGDFPETPEVEDTVAGLVPGAELARALRQVVRAASPDEARPVLTGVLWALEGGLLRLVATDSYRLAIREVAVKEGPAEGSAIVPGRALAEFGRYLAGVGERAAEVRLGETQAEFSVGRARLVTRLIEGEFPNYRQLLPEGYGSRLVADREALLEAVGRVGLVAQANTPVKIHLDRAGVKVTAVESGVGEATESLGEVGYEGEPMIVAFNPRFLAEGVEAVEGEKAVLELSDPLKPALVKAEGREDFIYLVMPVRLPR